MAQSLRNDRGLSMPYLHTFTHTNLSLDRPDCEQDWHGSPTSFASMTPSIGSSRSSASEQNQARPQPVPPWTPTASLTFLTSENGQLNSSAYPYPFDRHLVEVGSSNTGNRGSGQPESSDNGYSDGRHRPFYPRSTVVMPPYIPASPSDDFSSWSGETAYSPLLSSGGFQNPYPRPNSGLSLSESSGQTNTFWSHSTNAENIATVRNTNNSPAASLSSIPHHTTQYPLNTSSGYPGLPLGGNPFSTGEHTLRPGMESQISFDGHLPVPSEIEGVQRNASRSPNDNQSLSTSPMRLSPASGQGRSSRARTAYARRRDPLNSSSNHGSRQSQRTVRDRPLTCPLLPYGCSSTFATKNEWKRHINYQHICLGFWRCDLCHNATTRPNDFNRKDLFTQHLRRMHTGQRRAGSGGGYSLLPHAHAPDDPALHAELEAAQTRCWTPLRHPPQRLSCVFCARHFTGPRCTDDWLEHVGRHLTSSGTASPRANERRGALTTENRPSPDSSSDSRPTSSPPRATAAIWAQDSSLRAWLVREGLIAEVRPGQWRMRDRVSGGDMAIDVASIADNRQAITAEGDQENAADIETEENESGSGQDAEGEVDFEVDGEGDPDDEVYTWDDVYAAGGADAMGHR